MNKFLRGIGSLLLSVIMLLTFSSCDGELDSELPDFDYQYGDTEDYAEENTSPRSEETHEETAAPETAKTTETAGASETTEATKVTEEELTSEEPEEEYVYYYFRNDDLYDSHYKKHGAEFGDITKEEYLDMANQLINSDSDTVLYKTEKEDGDYLFYDTEKNWFLVLSTDGYIRTFFRPDDGMDYWERQ